MIEPNYCPFKFGSFEQRCTFYHLLHPDRNSFQGLITYSVTRLGDFWHFLATSFITKVAKCLVTFWAVVKTITFQVNVVRLLLGNLLNKLGNFLFQHLVTLITSYSFRHQVGTGTTNLCLYIVAATNTSKCWRLV